MPHSKSIIVIALDDGRPSCIWRYARPGWAARRAAAERPSILIDDAGVTLVESSGEHQGSLFSLDDIINSIPCEILHVAKAKTNLRKKASRRKP